MKFSIGRKVLCLEKVFFTGKPNFKSKSVLSLYPLCYTKACNEFAGPISALLRPGDTASFKKMSQPWRALGSTVSDLTGPRFEPLISRSNALPLDYLVGENQACFFLTFAVVYFSSQFKVIALVCKFFRYHS